MKIGYLGLALLLTPVWTLAQNPFHPDGAMASFGAAAGRHSVIAVTSNPAAPSTLVGSDTIQYRFGIVSAAGFNLELGGLDNFVDDIDDLVDRLDDDLSTSEAIELADEFNAILPKIGEHGFINSGISAHLPGFPIAISHTALEGTLLVDMYIGTQFHGRALDNTVRVNPMTNEVETNSAVYTKAGIMQQFSVGFSRPVYYDNGGEMLAGFKAKFVRIGLNKAVVGIDELADDQKSVTSYYEDEFYGELDYSAGLTFDAGLMWVSRNYQFGASLNNIFSPEFDYPKLGSNCTDLTAEERERCYIARTFASEIDLTENYKPTTQLKVEGSIFTSSMRRGVSFSMDLNAANDLVGFKRQWLAIAGFWTPTEWINLRGGIRKNLTGTSLSMLTIGTSLFRSVNFDLAYGLDSITVEGDNLPQWLTINIGAELVF